MKRKTKLLPIRLYGDKILRQKAKKVSEFTPEINEFIADLVFTMYEKDGVGLAAPQVGRSLRIFVVDPFWFQEDQKKNPIVLVNPEFIKFEGQVTSDEGCLSFPDIFETVNRAEKAIIKGQNEKGEIVKFDADGLFSRAVQHEYDHLEGILFIDKIPKLRKLMITKKLKDLKATTDKNGVNLENYRKK